MSNLNSLRESLARKQAELASLEHELRSAQAAQFSELPAQLGVETIDDVIRTLAPHASPRLKGALAKAFGGKLPAPAVELAGEPESPAPAAQSERRKRATVTPELKDTIVQALQAGKTSNEVAAECGVSPATVNNIKRAAGLTKKRGDA